jgi:hypothetical protein
MNVKVGRQNILILSWKYRGTAVSFLGIHKSEPDIYIVCSPALHLQCRVMQGLLDRYYRL